MNWPQLMAVGFGQLRLSPGAFWSMTPRELAAATRGLFGVPAEPMTAAALTTLTERYPDG